MRWERFVAETMIRSRSHLVLHGYLLVLRGLVDGVCLNLLRMNWKFAGILAGMFLPPYGLCPGRLRCLSLCISRPAGLFACLGMPGGSGAGASGLLGTPYVEDVPVVFSPEHVVLLVRRRIEPAAGGEIARLRYRFWTRRPLQLRTK